MAQHLAQHFVVLRCRPLGAERVPELALDHREGRFDVAALVVVVQELIALEHVIVVHLAPQLRPLSRRVDLEGDIGHGVEGDDSLKVLVADVALVGAYLVHREALRRLLRQRGEIGRIIGATVGNLDAGHDVGFHARHQMDLDPLTLTANLAVFGVVPPLEARRGEAARVGGEARLDGFEGAGALLDQGFEDGRQGRVFEVLGRGVVVRRLDHAAFRPQVRQVADRAPPRLRGVDLEHDAERYIGEGGAGPAHALRGLYDTLTQAVEQFRHARCLVRLSGVVGGPILFVGRLDRLGQDHRFSRRRGCGAIGGYRRRGRDRAADGVLDGVDVLALLVP